MDKELIKTCVDYINAHVRELHKLTPGPDGKPVDLGAAVGKDITVEDVVSSRESGDEAILIVNRGIKGSPKYHLSLQAVEDWAATRTVTAKAKEVVKAMTGKTDEVKK